MDERQLVIQAKQGDFRAFTQLVDAHKAKIFALARRLAGNEQDAEDIVQESLLKAIDNIDTFRGEASFGTWLFSIALNEARGHLARQKRQELRSIEEYLPSQDSHNTDVTTGQRLSDWEDPHTKLESEELQRIIDQGLFDLPYIYREAFVLRYVEDLPVKEVADMIGQSEAATKSRILRARLALRDYLARQFEAKHG